MLGQWELIIDIFPISSPGGAEEQTVKEHAFLFSLNKFIILVGMSQQPSLLDRHLSHLCKLSP
jgi:hypothetical protein